MEMTEGSRNRIQQGSSNLKFSELPAKTSWCHRSANEQTEDHLNPVDFQPRNSNSPQSYMNVLLFQMNMEIGSECLHDTQGNEFENSQDGFTVVPQEYWDQLFEMAMLAAGN
jgi:hypothetical protein